MAKLPLLPSPLRRRSLPSRSLAYSGSTAFSLGGILAALVHLLCRSHVWYANFAFCAHILFLNSLLLRNESELGDVAQEVAIQVQYHTPSSKHAHLQLLTTLSQLAVRAQEMNTSCCDFNNMSTSVSLLSHVWQPIHAY